MPSITVKDDHGSTRQVDIIKILVVTPDVDELLFEKLHKAYLVSPNQILLVVPSNSSIHRKARQHEYDRWAKETSTAEEINTRAVNKNASEAKKERLFLLDFPEEIELETRYTQQATVTSEAGKIKHSFTTVQYYSAAGSNISMISTEIAYKVSVVPIQDRIVNHPEVQEEDEAQVLLRRFQGVGLQPPPQQQRQQQQQQNNTFWQQGNNTFRPQQQQQQQPSSLYGSGDYCSSGAYPQNSTNTNVYGDENQHHNVNGNQCEQPMNVESFKSPTATGLKSPPQSGMGGFDV